MRQWFRDDLFASVLKNAGKLGSTKVMGALLGLLALYSAGHSMSAHDFGSLMLMVAYVQSVVAIGQFQSWQVVLHYGSVPWQKGDRETVKTALRFAIGLDVYVGIICMLGGILALVLFGKQLGVHHEDRLMAVFFCTQIPGMVSSSTYGILRLFDRVDVVAQQQVIAPVVRSILGVLAWVCGFGLFGFVIAWYMAQISSQLYVVIHTWRELKRRDMLDGLYPSLFRASRAMPRGVWRFAWTASLTKALESAWNPVSCLIVGKGLGPAAAGLYSLAMTFITAVQHPATLLEKSYYPEVVRLDLRTLKPWRLAVRTSLLSVLLALVAIGVVYIGGRPVISLFGHRYGDAATLMMWMSPSLIFYMAGLPMEGVLYSAGRSGMIMVIQLVAVSVYLPLLIMGCRYGLEGAGLAYTSGIALLNLLAFAVTLVTFWRRRHIVPPHEFGMG